MGQRLYRSLTGSAVIAVGGRIDTSMICPLRTGSDGARLGAGVTAFGFGKGRVSVGRERKTPVSGVLSSPGGSVWLAEYGVIW